MNFKHIQAVVLLSLSLVPLAHAEFAETDSKCMKDFRTLRNRDAVRAGLVPVVGLAGVVESAVLAFDWEYAGWGAFKASLGGFLPTAEILVQHVIPSVALLGMLGYETYSVTRFVEANRAFHLLQDVYGIGNGRMLGKVTRAIQKQKPALTQEDIRELIIKADQDGNLCSGNWVGGQRGRHTKKTLPRRVAYLGDIKREIIKQESNPISPR